MNVYRSPYEAYPFLSDKLNDFRCDFEILTDEISSTIGLLRSKTEDETLQSTLLWLCEMVYHVNPTLRTHFSVTNEEVEKLAQMVQQLEIEMGNNIHGFLLPQGCETACLCHILRTKCKALVRLTYRYQYASENVPTNALLDFCNLLSGYFFFLAIYYNKSTNTPEFSFTGRNYSI